MAQRDMNGWQPALPHMQLDGDEVHVWRAPLSGSSEMRRHFEEILSPDERTRANRFHFECHRDRFIRARGVLRRLLGGYLGADPAALVFAYSSFGKPALAGEHASGLAFNVSHSEDLALFALSRRGDLGVDVEAIRSLPDRDSLARELFCHGEVRSLDALGAELKDDAFFSCWTRKEAFVKAIGDGLSRPLDQFEVTFTGDERPSLRVIDDARESARWSLYGLSPGAGFAAALVTEGARRISCWQWPDALPVHLVGSQVWMDVTEAEEERI